ncbi:MAG: transcription termination/antitermination protein NusA [Cytophagia bacterium]|nr:MAG: transcription termination/antitermination protein NusA [Cytophagales bacterium]TAG00886.1 MAG: transcription termination/antitermination protein NusA [Cytophagia bacterium]TAG38078.1 MAG: transcription termination/antitermination protein NusA [Cytophagia bacterium]TAH29100.1 MAG: transcription termination/antitermination protein NusA [Cytophagales bacterium]
MAKKQQPEKESKQLIESFAEFAKTKNIDSTLMIKLLEDVFRAMIRKKYDDDDSNFDVIINTDGGELEMRQNLIAVADDTKDFDVHKQIKLVDARKIDKECEIGEDISLDIHLEDFGRRAILMARQTLIQRAKDVEKLSIYQKYKDREGEIVTVLVDQVVGKDAREIYCKDDDGHDLVLPRLHQIPRDKFRKGDNLRAVIEKVDFINGTPKILLSRTSPNFLKRLFETEIPEVMDGIIVVKNVVREPGERAKIAVETFDDRIDPVGACVGTKGSRIHGIVKELNSENIDVINYTENLELYISRALSPAKITSITVEDKNRVSVYMKPDQVSWAIGRSGYNIRLAGKLVGMEIDVFRDDQEELDEEEDVELTEFSDEIEQWVIEELHRVGLDTAKRVIEFGKDLLLKRTELEEEQIDEILELLKKEFE